RMDEVQMADEIGPGPPEIVGDGLVGCLFACKPGKSDVVCGVVDELLQGEHGGRYSWLGGLVSRLWTMPGSVSVASAWRMSASDMSRAISASSSRCVWVAVSGTSRMKSRLAARPSVA